MTEVVDRFRVTHLHDRHSVHKVLALLKLRVKISDDETYHRSASAILEVDFREPLYQKAFEQFLDLSLNSLWCRY